MVLKTVSSWPGSSFIRQRQTPSDTVDDFISRQTHTARACAFGQIEPGRVEAAMLIQALIGGVRDDRPRESLLAESRTLEWEKACKLARNREAMQRELHQFPLAEIPLQ